MDVYYDLSYVAVWTSQLYWKIFEGKMCPKECIRPVLPTIVCYSPFFMMILIVTSKMPKIFVVVCYDLCYEVVFHSWTCQPIFNVK